MDTDQFWSLIERVHQGANGVMDAKCRLLKQELSALPDGDLQSFAAHFDRFDARAYAWPLWGAAYVLNGGCSDDAFTDFRATLISMGRRIYEAALDDPNSLGGVQFDRNEACYEGFQYALGDALEARWGERPPREVAFPRKAPGEEWDEDTVETLFPGLEYLGGGDGPPPQSKPRPWWKFW